MLPLVFSVTEIDAHAVVLVPANGEVLSCMFSS